MTLNNLFILHTQYNIILGNAIINKSFLDSKNYLILLSEFKIEKSYLDSLESLFEDVIILKDNFYTGNRFGEINMTLSSLKKLKRYKIPKKFSNIILSQERFLDTCILSRISDNESKYIFVEEDVYYKPVLLTEEKLFRKLARSSYYNILKLLFRNKMFENVIRYGSSSYIDSLHIIFKDVVDKPFNNFNLVQISKLDLIKSTNQIYNYIKLPQIYSGYKFVFIILDLVSRIADKEKYFKTISNFMTKEFKGFRTIVKAHPRERDFSFSHIFPDSLILDNKVASEIFFMKFTDSIICTIGSVSNALLFSKKINIDTYSLIRFTSNRPDIKRVYKKIGIKIL